MTENYAFRKWRARLVLAAVPVVLTAAVSGYMTYIRAPSVVAIRPELAEVGWWTALWSGRFESWLWYHHPLPATVVTFVFLVGVTLIVGWWE